MGPVDENGGKPRNSAGVALTGLPPPGPVNEAEQQPASFFGSPPTSLPPLHPELFALPEEQLAFEIRAEAGVEANAIMPTTIAATAVCFIVRMMNSSEVAWGS